MSLPPRHVRDNVSSKSSAVLPPAMPVSAEGRPVAVADVVWLSGGWRNGVGILRRSSSEFCCHPYYRCDAGTGKVVRRVCGRWQCSLECRKRWQMRMTWRLHGVLQAHEHHHVRLKCHRAIPDRLLSAAHSHFFRRLRRQSRTEFFSINEWSHGQRHLHALVRGDVPPGLVHETWRKLILPGEPVSSSCTPVRNAMAMCRYVVKIAELPPVTFMGRLYSQSRHFFDIEHHKVSSYRGHHHHDASP